MIQNLSATQAAVTDMQNRGAGVGGKEGGGEAMTVQQILMPPDTDFLSSFYEAAEVWPFSLMFGVMMCSKAHH